MAWLSNGIALRNAAQVFGASCSSKRAWNVKSPAWTISWLIYLSNLAVGGSGDPIQPELATRSKERSNLPPNLAAAILAPRDSIAGDLGEAALLVRLPSIK